MKTRTQIPLALAALLLSLVGPALAADDPADPFHDMKSPYETGQFEYDDSGDKPWQEGTAEVPPLPADADLLAVRLDALPAGLQAYMAPSTLSYTPDDRVFRYWLIIKSPAGAYNASYEGLRCDVQEYRIYAYGNPRRQPPVRGNSDSQWRSLAARDVADYRREIMLTLLCDEARRPRPMARVVATLRGQRAYGSVVPDNPDY